MESIVTIKSATNVFEKHGEDTIVGLSLKVYGTFHEELANRFIFGSDYGTLPEDIKGHLTKCFWGDEALRFYGVNDINASKTKFYADVKIGDHEIKEVKLSKAKVTPSSTRGVFLIVFNIHIGEFNDELLTMLNHYANSQVGLRISMVQDDLTESNDDDQSSIEGE